MFCVSSASPASLDLARRLLELQSAGEKTLPSDARVRGVDSSLGSAQQVCERLRTVLTAFAGSAGFRSLLKRALTLAKAEEPSLARLQVREDGTLEDLETARSDSPAGPAGRVGSGGLVLVAQLLDLLILFIGQPLMLQLVSSAWPEGVAGAPRSKTEDTP
jgi:hypothetical protein